MTWMFFAGIFKEPHGHGRVKALEWRPLSRSVRLFQNSPPSILRSRPLRNVLPSEAVRRSYRGWLPSEWQSARALCCEYLRLSLLCEVPCFDGSFVPMCRVCRDRRGTQYASCSRKVCIRKHLEQIVSMPFPYPFFDRSPSVVF